MPAVPPPRKGLLYVKPSKVAPPRRGAPAAGAVGTARVGPTAKGGDEGYLYLAGVRDGSKRITEFSSEKDVCPVCHTDRQFNPSLRLLVSPCYHRMCESCIDRLFTLGPEPCPTCGRVLRKLNFQHQTFEDLKVEKEVSVRRRVAESFNKREEDFTSMKEYDDYLEKVENWTFNLLNEIDVDETEKAISSYIKANQPSIAANKERLALESLSQAERDDIDKRAREERMRMVEDAERLERIEDERVKAAIVDALAKGSKVQADEIRQKHETAKAHRAAALEKALPPSLRAVQEGKVENTTDPLAADYTGVYVPIPYSSPESMEWTDWFRMKPDYVDGRKWVTWAKEDRDGKVRGGGWDIHEFWRAEIEAGIMSLGIEPLRGL